MSPMQNVAAMQKGTRQPGPLMPEVRTRQQLILRLLHYQDLSLGLRQRMINLQTQRIATEIRRLHTVNHAIQAQIPAVVKVIRQHQALNHQLPIGFRARIFTIQARGLLRQSNAITRERRVLQILKAGLRDGKPTAAVKQLLKDYMTFREKTKGKKNVYFDPSTRLELKVVPRGQKLVTSTAEAGALAARATKPDVDEIVVVIRYDSRSSSLAGSDSRPVFGMVRLPRFQGGRANKEDKPSS